MNAHNEMVAADEWNAWGFDTFFNRFRGPSLISVIETWERMLLVTKIEGSTWEFAIGVQQVNQVDGNHRWWNRIDLTPWESKRQRFLTLGVLRQLVSSWFGLGIDNPVYPAYLYNSNMKVVSWNCHGAGDNKFFRRDFQEYVRIHQPSVVFVLETRVTEDEAWNIVPFLGFNCYEIAPTSDMFGGIWMLWNDFVVDVEVNHTEFEGIYATIRPAHPCRSRPAKVYSRPKKTAKIQVYDSTIEGDMILEYA